MGKDYRYSKEDDYEDDDYHASRGDTSDAVKSKLHKRKEQSARDRKQRKQQSHSDD
ncbi:hypothetical protein [Glaciecola sp. 1036]|uniref:hypothetical protein n=1 Tax=Alteromonadaceae TaxID=72275 RepID=UPI003D0233AC